MSSLLTLRIHRTASRRYVHRPLQRALLTAPPFRTQRADPLTLFRSVDPPLELVSSPASLRYNEQKLNSLRVEADAASERADELAAKNKQLEQELLTKDQEIASLQHKLSVAEGDLDKLESKLHEHKAVREEHESNASTSESLQRKVDLLESELDTAEKNLRETTDK